MTDNDLINAVRHLCTHGPVTTLTGRPCAYDVRQYFGLALAPYGELHRLATCGDPPPLREYPSPQGDIYPPEFGLSPRS